MGLIDRVDSQDVVGVGLGQELVYCEQTLEVVQQKLNIALGSNQKDLIGAKNVVKNKVSDGWW